MVATSLLPNFSSFYFINYFSSTFYMNFKRMTTAFIDYVCVCMRARTCVCIQALISLGKKTKNKKYSSLFLAITFHLKKTISKIQLRVQLRGSSARLDCARPRVYPQTKGKENPHKA